MADNDNSARQKLKSAVGPTPPMLDNLGQKGAVRGYLKAKGTPYHAETLTPHSFSQGDGVINRIVNAASRADAKKKLGPPEIH